MLAHEITHLIWFEYMGHANPDYRWVNEGLAVYQENKTFGGRGQGDMFSALRGNLRSQPISMDQMIHLVPATERAYDVSLWYAQSESMVRFMIERGGRIGFSQFLSALRYDKNLDQSVAEGFPGSWRTLEARARLEAEPAVIILPAGVKRVVLPVRGMHCASCVSKLEGALTKIAGVRAVSVDLPSRTVAVEFMPVPGVLEVRTLRRAIEKAGYDVLGESESRGQAESMSLLSQQAEQRALMTRLQVAVVFSVPLMLAQTLNLSAYSALCLAVPVQIWGGWHFHQGFSRALLRRRADMDTLVSISTWAAFLYSAYVVLFPRDPAAPRLASCSGTRSAA